MKLKTSILLLAALMLLSATLFKTSKYNNTDTFTPKVVTASEDYDILRVVQKTPKCWCGTLDSAVYEKDITIDIADNNNTSQLNYIITGLKEGYTVASNYVREVYTSDATSEYGNITLNYGDNEIDMLVFNEDDVLVYACSDYIYLHGKTSEITPKNSTVDIIFSDNNNTSELNYTVIGLKDGYSVKANYSRDVYTSDNESEYGSFTLNKSYTYVCLFVLDENETVIEKKCYGAKYEDCPGYLDANDEESIKIVSPVTLPTEPKMISMSRFNGSDVEIIVTDNNSTSQLNYMITNLKDGYTVCSNYAREIYKSDNTYEYGNVTLNKGGNTVTFLVFDENDVLIEEYTRTYTSTQDENAIPPSPTCASIKFADNNKTSQLNYTVSYLKETDTIKCNYAREIYMSHETGEYGGITLNEGNNTVTIYIIDENGRLVTKKSTTCSYTLVS